MSKTLSLKDLKRQNAEAEEAKQEPQDLTDDAPEEIEELDEVETEEAEDSEPEQEEEPEDGGDHEEGETESDDGEDDLESWMGGSEKPQDDQKVPLNKHVNMRKKLKGKLHEAEDENAQLKRQVEELTRIVNGNGVPQQPAPAQQQAAPQPAQNPRPKRADFENEYGELNEDAYDAAVDDWNFKRMQSFQDQQRTEAQRSQVQKQQLENTQKVVDAHYDRAAELVNSGKVKAETYQKADANVRRRCDAEQPGNGDAIADALIEQVDAIAGDKSALVMFKLGADANALEAVIQGFKQGGEIGGIREISKINNSIQLPGKTKSKAVKPPKQISGDKKATPSGNALKKKVAAARKAGNTQAVITLKRQARAEGHDTADW